MEKMKSKKYVPRAWELEYEHVHEMSMDKPIALSNTEGTRGLQVKNAKNEFKKRRSPELGNQNMNMSMDKPIVLSNTEGTRGPQAKNAKNEFKIGNQNMNMSMDKPIALSSTEATRGSQVKNAKVEVPRP